MEPRECESCGYPEDVEPGKFILFDMEDEDGVFWTYLCRVCAEDVERGGAGGEVMYLIRRSQPGRLGPGTKGPDPR